MVRAAPLKSMAAEDCVAALISSWVAKFGVPTIITSDQGRQFTSSLWAGLTKMLGIKQAGISSAATAAGQRNAVSAVKPILAGKLPLFSQLILQRFQDVVNHSIRSCHKHLTEWSIIWKPGGRPSPHLSADYSILFYSLYKSSI